jgi:2,4-dienoyl-CoA reductase-like NADH-dependent reductase (Old Yellow Enzyme family)
MSTGAIRDVKMDILFEPIRINGMVLKNRFVRTATAERMSPPDGGFTQEMVNLCTKLARGGVGLIITGHAYIHPLGKAERRMTGIHNDDLIPALKKLVDEVHKFETKIIMQINHSGGRRDKDVGEETPIGPSTIEYEPLGIVSRAMDPEEIEEVIDLFAKAAQRVKDAGFDGVEIHSVHGYLINQFLSPLTNKREDTWGGSLENRMRFLLEVYNHIRGTVGKDYPVLAKIPAGDFVEGGLTVDEACEVAKKLSELRIDAIELSGGLAGSRYRKGRKDLAWMRKEAYFRSYTGMVKKVTRVPVILVGGLKKPETMRKILEEGVADLIGLARPLIREPDFPNRIRKGDFRRAKCVSCSNCSGRSGREPTRCRAKK